MRTGFRKTKELTLGMLFKESAHQREWVKIQSLNLNPPACPGHVHVNLQCWYGETLVFVKEG